MKNLLKIGALSLALIAVVFTLNKTNAQTTTTGIVKVEITAKTGYCVYWLNWTGGTTPYSTNTTGYLSGNFNTTGGNAIWFCEDSEGDTAWTLGISSADLKAWNGDATHTISNANIYASGSAASVISWACTANVWDISADWTTISTTKTVLGKTSTLSETCTVATDKVQLKVDVPPLKAIGTYTWVLTVTISAGFGNGTSN